MFTIRSYTDTKISTAISKIFKKYSKKGAKM
jgi:hypothetical protein